MLAIVFKVREDLANKGYVLQVSRPGACTAPPGIPGVVTAFALRVNGKETVRVRDGIETSYIPKIRPMRSITMEAKYHRNRLGTDPGWAEHTTDTSATGP